MRRLTQALTRALACAALLTACAAAFSVNAQTPDLGMQARAELIQRHLNQWNTFNTARIPVTAFAGVNLSDLRSVQFSFNQSPQGAPLISDVAFASPP